MFWTIIACAWGTTGLVVSYPLLAKLKDKHKVNKKKRMEKRLEYLHKKEETKKPKTGVDALSPNDKKEVESSLEGSLKNVYFINDFIKGNSYPMSVNTKFYYKIDSGEVKYIKWPDILGRLISALQLIESAPQDLLYFDDVQSSLLDLKDIVTDFENSYVKDNTFLYKDTYNEYEINIAKMVVSLNFKIDKFFEKASEPIERQSDFWNKKIARNKDLKSIDASVENEDTDTDTDTTSEDDQSDDNDEYENCEDDLGDSQNNDGSFSIDSDNDFFNSEFNVVESKITNWKDNVYDTPTTTNVPLTTSTTMVNPKVKTFKNQFKKQLTKVFKSATFPDDYYLITLMKIQESNSKDTIRRIEQLLSVNPCLTESEKNGLYEECITRLNELNKENLQ